jgi:hypothetical protein
MKEHPTMVPTYIGPRNSFTVSGVADMGLDVSSLKRAVDLPFMLEN